MTADVRSTQGTITIGKRFKFEAAHFLEGLPDGHKCGAMHGHSYIVEISVTSERLQGPGFVVDFAELRPFKEYIDEKFDHRVLNTVLQAQPTAENVAIHLAEWYVEHLQRLIKANLQAVRVWETATSWAEYTA